MFNGEDKRESVNLFVVEASTSKFELKCLKKTFHHFIIPQFLSVFLKFFTLNSLKNGNQGEFLFFPHKMSEFKYFSSIF